MTTAIILAAGKSTRMGGGTDKAFLSLVNKPVIAWSLLAFERCPDIDRIVLVVRKEQQVAAKAVCKMFGISKLDKVVTGGKTRQDSVQCGLAACDCDTRSVVIHDGARPCVTADVVSAVVGELAKNPAVTVGRRVVDTIKTCAKACVVESTVERANLWSVQTPQAFQFRVLRDAYKTLGKNTVTDDCQVVEKAGVPVKIVEHLRPNIKITTVEDLQLVGMILK